MAKTRNGGSTGSITITGHGGDLASFNARFTQPVDDCTNYSSGSWTENNGAGVTGVAVDAQGFLAFGSTGTNPHPDSLESAGANCTLQWATGCTLIGPLVISDVSMGNARKSGVAPISISAVNAGNMTFAWAEA